MSNNEFVNFIDLDRQVQFKILEWRNNEFIRKNMFNCNLITRKEHIKFINSLYNDKYKHYYLIYNNQVPIGVVYITINKDSERYGEGGIYADPDRIGTGVGKELLETLIYICTEKLKIEKLYLLVKKDNLKALKLYKSLGFIIEDESLDFYISRKDLL